MEIYPWPRADHRLLSGGLLLPGDSTLRTLASTSISLGTLTTHRKTLAMTLALIAVDLNLTTDVSVNLTTQIAFNLVIGLKIITQGDQLFIRKILDAREYLLRQDVPL